MGIFQNCKPLQILGGLVELVLIIVIIRWQFPEGTILNTDASDSAFTWTSPGAELALWLQLTSFLSLSGVFFKFALLSISRRTAEIMVIICFL